MNIVLPIHFVEQSRILVAWNTNRSTPMRPRRSSAISIAPCRMYRSLALLICPRAMRQRCRSGWSPMDPFQLVRSVCTSVELYNNINCFLQQASMPTPCSSIVAASRIPGDHCAIKRISIMASWLSAMASLSIPTSTSHCPIGLWRTRGDHAGENRATIASIVATIRAASARWPHRLCWPKLTPKPIYIYILYIYTYKSVSTLKFWQHKILLACVFCI